MYQGRCLFTETLRVAPVPSFSCDFAQVAYLQGRDLCAHVKWRPLPLSAYMTQRWEAIYPDVLSVYISSAKVRARAKRVGAVVAGASSQHLR